MSDAHLGTVGATERLPLQAWEQVVLGTSFQTISGIARLQQAVPQFLVNPMKPLRYESRFELRKH